MSRRIQPSRAVIADILIKSGRRCCLCFGLNGDLSIKPGQIAHLDRDPTNSSPDNLAFLCLPHHDEYDTKTSVSRGITIAEVKAYRDSLYQSVARLRTRGLRHKSGSAPSDDQRSPIDNADIARGEYRRRDIATLHRLFSTIHTDLLDDFFDAGIHGIFPIDVAVCHDQFEIIVNASRFHIYDPRLRERVLAFSDAWRACFSYSNYLFPALTAPEALQFQSPYTVDNPEDIIEAFNNFQKHMISARAAFRDLVSFVLQYYPEVDIDQTNRTAWEMLRSTWPDVENERD